MAEFDVGVAFQVLTNSVQKVDSTLSGMLPAKPIWKQLGVSNIQSALTTQTLIIPQGPATGRMWFIHRTGVFGADGHTSVAGIADVFAGPGQEADQSAQIYSGLTIPSIVVEGMNTNPVMPNERVYAIFTNLTAQQVLQFTVLVEEYPLPAAAGMSAN